MRKKFTGKVIVLRESSFSECLYAEVETECGRKFSYYPSPKAFVDYAYEDGRSNEFYVEFTANEDGTNPRAIRV